MAADGAERGDEVEAVNARQLQVHDNTGRVSVRGPHQGVERIREADRRQTLFLEQQEEALQNRRIVIDQNDFGGLNARGNPFGVIGHRGGGQVRRLGPGGTGVGVGRNGH